MKIPDASSSPPFTTAFRNLREGRKERRGLSAGKYKIRPLKGLRHRIPSAINKASRVGREEGTASGVKDISPVGPKDFSSLAPEIYISGSSSSSRWHNVGKRAEGWKMQSRADMAQAPVLFKATRVCVCVRVWFCKFGLRLVWRLRRVTVFFLSFVIRSSFFFSFYFI